MTNIQATGKPRQRAPSKRALATRTRVFDAAEKVFADRGFDGATIRMIATEADEPLGTIHHHGGGKDALFRQTVARRAATLSQGRLKALARLEAPATMAAVLEAFIRPFFDLVVQEPRWRNYARLVAFVSVDDRWRALSAECFDPTAEVFLAEIKRLAPHATPQQTAEAFVFTVAAMLALLTSQGRISDLAGGSPTQPARIDHLVAFCAAGFTA